jgi:hypothetical protein
MTIPQRVSHRQAHSMVRVFLTCWSAQGVVPWFLQHDGAVEAGATIRQAARGPSTPDYHWRKNRRSGSAS